MINKKYRELRLKTGAILTALLLTSVPMTSLAAETTADNKEASSYGYLAGQQKNKERHQQYEAIAALTTDEERQSFYESHNIGGGVYEDAQHLDMQALLKAGVIDQVTADLIAKYASDKHDDIHSRFGSAAGMTPDQRHAYYDNFSNDGFSGDSLEELVENGVLTQDQADAVSAYTAGFPPSVRCFGTGKMFGRRNV